jgi:hypothetical protein
MVIDYDNNRERLTYRIYPIKRSRLPIQKPGHAAEQERGGHRQIAGVSACPFVLSHF